MPTKNCETCGKEFEVEPKKHRQKHCTWCANHVVTKKRKPKAITSVPF